MAPESRLICVNSQELTTTLQTFRIFYVNWKCKNVFLSFNFSTLQCTGQLCCNGYQEDYSQNKCIKINRWWKQLLFNCLEIGQYTAIYCWCLGNVCHMFWKNIDDEWATPTWINLQLFAVWIKKTEALDMNAKWVVELSRTVVWLSITGGRGITKW